MLVVNADFPDLRLLITGKLFALLLRGIELLSAYRIKIPARICFESSLGRFCYDNRLGLGLGLDFGDWPIGTLQIINRLFASVLTYKSADSSVWAVLL